MKKLLNKTVLITGATSGIGRSTAYLLAEHGANIIIAGRRKERLEEAASELDKSGVKVYTMQLDVRNYDDVEKAVSELPDEWKKIDILVNNAGLSRGLNKIHEGVLDDWEEMIDTNVKGLLYVSKCVIPLMLANNSGHVVNIGSIAGHEVYPAGNVYCATKHAVDAITKGMRMDLNGTGVKVTTIDPGLVETEFSNVRFRGDDERAKAVYKGMTPLTPDEVAEAILFVVTCSENMVVAEMILLPKDQASSTMVHRS
ncbi:MAG: SDR family oxidoreductase [Ignavibacteriae bacterium]|nr:SDR family oxidoreductase [Ignavibacteriota bacterium]MCB9243066.1 SDR family oxidoreductase [Ignavibacteriales bacterium]